MAHIKKIKFSRVGKQEGCTCDRCGQYIRNIWTVDYKEGLTMNYGIDCWEAICKEGLSKQGIRLMNKTMKSLQSYEERLAAYTSKEIMAKNIRRFLEIKHMTIKECAEAIGVPVSTVGDCTKCG